jgi:hypothetical protein
MVSRFVRRVRTGSGAVAVEVVTKQGRQVVAIDHVGSARTDAELALLLEAAAGRVLPGQETLVLEPTSKADSLRVLAGLARFSSRAGRPPWMWITILGLTRPRSHGVACLTDCGDGFDRRVVRRVACNADG